MTDATNGVLPNGTSSRFHPETLDQDKDTRDQQGQLPTQTPDHTDHHGDSPPISQAHGSPVVPVGQDMPSSSSGGLRIASRRAAQRRSRQASKNVLMPSTYDQLTALVQAAARRSLKLLILVGRPGCGKSQVVQAIFGPGALYLRGRVTPMRMFIRLFRHREQPVILDDLDTLLADPLGLGVLLELCSTDTERTVSWQSTSKILEEEKVPPSFTFTGVVVIITNNWDNVHKKLPALEDRGVLVFFDPSPLELHTRAASWFDDQEIHDFIGANLPFIPALSLRHYVIARDIKHAGLPWQDTLIDARRVPALRLVAQLKVDATYLKEEDRARAFVEQGAGSRATYFRYAKKLTNLQPVPPIPLRSAGRPFVEE